MGDNKYIDKFFAESIGWYRLISNKCYKQHGWVKVTHVTLITDKPISMWEKCNLIKVCRIEDLIHLHYWSWLIFWGFMTYGQYSSHVTAVLIVFSDNCIAELNSWPLFYILIFDIQTFRFECPKCPVETKHYFIIFKCLHFIKTKAIWLVQITTQYQNT